MSVSCSRVVRLRLKGNVSACICITTFKRKKIHFIALLDLGITETSYSQGSHSPQKPHKISDYFWFQNDLCAL